MLSLDGMITVAEAARRLGRSLEQVRRYLREGKLKGQRIGGQWFVEEASLDMKRPIWYEEQVALLHEIRENREAIYREAGRLFSGAEGVRQLREERLKKFAPGLSRRKRRS